MVFKKFKDVILGILMVALSAFYLYQTQLIKVTKMSSKYANARFFPTVLGVLLAILGVICIIQGVRYAKKFDPETDGKGKKTDSQAVLLTFALIIAYVAAMQPVGFIISSMIYLFLQIMVLCPTEKRNPVLFAIVAVVFSLVIYSAFRFGLSLMLPPGIFSF